MGTTEYQAALVSIATRIADYRARQIPPVNIQHVDRWVAQFDQAVREPLLLEMDHILSQTYVSRETVVAFLTSLLNHQPLVGPNPAQFWRAANIFRAQRLGNSQREMLAIFDSLLQQTHGFGINVCGSPNGPCVYIDDASFSGGHVSGDLEPWVQTAAAQHATIHIAVMAYYSFGKYSTEKHLNEVAARLGKTLHIQWWSTEKVAEQDGLEDRKIYRDRSDVFWPKEIPVDPAVQAYVGTLKWAPILRNGDSVGTFGVFRSSDGRALMEREFLRAGVKIRGMCPYLNQHQRPLGNKTMPTLGFGATIVTFRNCPNNCPLAWWAGDPWYPLFRRKTNS
jgi:hypothetical protein